MDFELTNRQKQIRLAAREFSEGELTNIGAEFEAKAEFPKELVKKATEIGFNGVFIKKEYGGLGLGFLEHAIILEEFWRVDPGLGQVLCSITIAAEAIQLFGSEEQKKQYLPPMVRGDLIVGFSITEPEAGSDTASVSTTGKRDGNEYVVNGNKVMITNGTLAKLLLVYCLTHPDVSSKSKRHSIILVETERDGFKADRVHGKMGIRASDTANIYFNNVRVPKANLLGLEGNGFVQLMKFFDYSRAYVAAHGVGLAQGAMEQAINYVKKGNSSEKLLHRFRSLNSKLQRWLLLLKLLGPWFIKLVRILTAETLIPNCRPWQNGGPAMLQ